MFNFRKGTPQFGILLGSILVLIAGLFMWIGFWRTILLILLFSAGFFIGSVGDKSGFMKKAVGKIVPEKADETIDFRAELEKQQADVIQRSINRPESKSDSAQAAPKDASEV